MPSLFPFDLAIAGLLLLRRFGVAKTIVVGFVLLPVYLWSLPPVSCGCFGPVFRRCDRTLMYTAAMKSDLKNLASQQEIYWSDALSYTHDADALGFVPSDGVQVTVYASQRYWAASATHAATGEDRVCTIYYGEDPALGDLVRRGQPGEVVCTR